MEEIKINTKKWFFGFCGLHMVLWTIVPTVFFMNVYMDTAESIAWGYQFQLGYSKHPPLSGWLAASFAGLGPFTNLQMYLLGTILALVAFWAVWRLANRILSPVQALVSVFLLDCALYYNCYCVTIDPDSVQIPFWTLVFLTFYIALKEEKIYQWLLVGFCCALAFYTKLAAGLIFLPMIFVCLFTKEGRHSFLKPGIYLCGVLFLICILPHLIWSYLNGFSEITYALNASNTEPGSTCTFLESVVSSLNFIGAQLGFSVLLIVMVLFFLFARRDKTTKIGSFNKRYLFLMGTGPLILMLIYPIVFSTRLMPRWGFSMFSLAGIIAIAWIKPVITKKVFKRFIILFVLIICIVSGAYCIFYGYWSANVNGNYRPWSYFPGRNIATKVTDIWQERYHTPLKYIAGSHYLAAYITTYSKDHPTPYFDWDKEQSPWIDVNDMRKAGAMFAWWIHGPWASPGLKVMNEVRRCFPRMEILGTFRFNKVGIPKDVKPILKSYIQKSYPKLLEKPQINQFFPDYPSYVDIGIAVLPPARI